MRYFAMVRTAGRYHDLLWGDDDRGTAGTGITLQPMPTTTRSTALLLTEDAHDLRNRVRNLGFDVGQTHQKTYQHEWQVLTQQRALSSAGTMLSELADLGFSWRDIARMVGVSVAAIQKWRKGENVTGPNRHKLATLLAACDFIIVHFHAEDVAQWFETPIIDGAPITPIDIWSEGNYLVLFEYATQQMTPDQAMNEFRPDWRESFRSNWETFEAADGNLSIRAKGQ
jgi:transcriptional regulator with XRE-family HTH domain